MKYEDWLRYGGRNCDPYGNLPKDKCHFPDPLTGSDCDACLARRKERSSDAPVK